MNILSTILCRHCGRHVQPYLSASLEERNEQPVLVAQAECPICNTIHEGVKALGQTTLVYDFAGQRVAYRERQPIQAGGYAT